MTERFSAPWSRELKAALVDLRLCLALRRVGMAIDDWVHKYRPGQPRLPKGTPDRGGEWTIDPSSARQQQLAAERIRTALAAVLVGERVGLGDVGLVRHCIYVDMLGRPRTVEVNAMVPCRPTYPAAPL